MKRWLFTHGLLTYETIWNPFTLLHPFRVVFPAVYVLVKHSTRLRVLMNGALEKVYKYIVSGCKSVHDAVIYTLQQQPLHNKGY